MSGDANRSTSAASSRLDAVFEALAHERRRHALYYLREQPDGVASTADLAAALAARDGGPGDAPGERSGGVADGRDEDVAGGGGAGATVERVAASLVHHHLPKLADAGVVERDADAGTVRYVDDPVTDAFLDVGRSVEGR